MLRTFFAIPNALVSYEIFKKYEYFENTAIIDIGAGTTDICLIKDNKFHKGFSLNVGGDYYQWHYAKFGTWFYPCGKFKEIFWQDW